MPVELVRATTTDGVRLDGALHVPSPRGGAPHVPLDACLLLHGTGSNFYSSTLLAHLAERLVGLRCAALCGNTRGHDLATTTATTDGPRRLGAAYEVVDDCRHDVAAWTELLTQRGLGRVGLVGHSLGAVKAIYALAGAAPPPVVALVALSPARLSHGHFLAGRGADEFRAALAAAEAHVRDGRGDTLIEVAFPIPYVVTAAGYLDKYGPHERYDVARLIGRVRCPALVTFGGEEVREHVAFAGLPELLAQRAASEQRLQIVSIEGGDHLYSGVRDELAWRVERWLRGLSAG